MCPVTCTRGSISSATVANHPANTIVGTLSLRLGIGLTNQFNVGFTQEHHTETTNAFYKSSWTNRGLALRRILWNRQ